jgi:hypothetical protein
MLYLYLWGKARISTLFHRKKLYKGAEFRFRIIFTTLKVLLQLAESATFLKCFTGKTSSQ